MVKQRRCVLTRQFGVRAACGWVCRLASGGAGPGLGGGPWGGSLGSGCEHLQLRVPGLCPCICTNHGSPWVRP